MSENRDKPQLTPEQQRIVREAMANVTPAYDPATCTFDRIAISTGILCIECRACGHRAMLTKAECPQIRPGNQALVRAVKFRCGRQGCGSTDVRRYGGCEREEAELWLAGDPMDAIREIPATASGETWRRRTRPRPG